MQARRAPIALGRALEVSIRSPLRRALLPLFLASLVSTSHAGVITVGPTGAHTAIQPAVDAALDGDTILVAPGTYAPFTVDGKRLQILTSSTTVTVTSFTSEGSAPSVARARRTYVPGLLKIAVTIDVPPFTLDTSPGSKVTGPGPRQTTQETLSPSTAFRAAVRPRPGSTASGTLTGISN